MSDQYTSSSEWTCGNCGTVVLAGRTHICHVAGYAPPFLTGTSTGGCATCSKCGYFHLLTGPCPTVTVNTTYPPVLPHTICSRCNKPLAVHYSFGIPGSVVLVVEPHDCTGGA